MNASIDVTTGIGDAINSLAISRYLNAALCMAVGDISIEKTASNALQSLSNEIGGRLLVLHNCLRELTKAG